MPGVESWFLIGGMSILDGAVASNAAAMYVTFTPWSERTGRPGLSQGEILEHIGTRCKQVREGADLGVSAAGDRRPGSRGGLPDAD